MLEVRDLVKHYPAPGGDPVRAIDGVTLTVRPGEFVALYGPSGSGKTTLLKIIAAALPPDRGDVLVAGRSVIDLDERDVTTFRQRDLGLVLPTSHTIAGLSTLENAAFKLMAGGTARPQAQRQVMPLLVRLGLQARAQHRATDLSLGEQHRLALAKALSNDPPLLVADEPTGSLDTSRSRDVLQFLKDCTRTRQTAVLIATHDPQAAGYADTVHTLRDGHIAAFDPDQDARLAPAAPHP